MVIDNFWGGSIFSWLKHSLTVGCMLIWASACALTNNSGSLNPKCQPDLSAEERAASIETDALISDLLRMGMKEAAARVRVNHPIPSSQGVCRTSVIENGNQSQRGQSARILQAEAITANETDISKRATVAQSQVNEPKRVEPTAQVQPVTPGVTAQAKPSAILTAPPQFALDANTEKVDSPAPISIQPVQRASPSLSAVDVATRASPASPILASTSQTPGKQKVGMVRLVGNTAISDPELIEALHEFENSDRSKDTERKMSWKISQLYRQHGLLAHVYVRPESQKKEQWDLVMVESKLGQVKMVEGGESSLDKNVAISYVAAQLEINKPIVLSHIAKGVRLLNEVPGVSATSTLAPGTEAEHTDVVISVKDKPMIAASVRADNHGTAETGQLRAVGNLAINNPSGLGDQFTALGLSSASSRYVRLGYELALGHTGLRGGAHLGNMSYEIKGELASLGNSGHANNWGANLSYPLILESTSRLALSGGYTNHNLQDNALDMRMLARDARAISVSLAGSMRTNRGLTTFGATLARGRLNLEPGSIEYTSDQAGPRALGGFNKLTWNIDHQLPFGNRTELTASLSGQFASNNLDAGEKFALGGPNGVRAYAAADGQGDEGWLGRFEVRHNLGTDYRLLAFADIGGIRANKHPWNGWDANNPGQTNNYFLYGARALLGISTLS